MCFSNTLGQQLCGIIKGSNSLFIVIKIHPLLTGHLQKEKEGLKCLQWLIQPLFNFSSSSHKAQLEVEVHSTSAFAE